MYKILEPIMVRMPLYSHEEYKKLIYLQTLTNSYKILVTDLAF